MRGEGVYSARELPNLILLDLNLPRVSGYAVLREVKAEEQYRSIPVIVLSGSEAQQDIYYSYTNNAAAYLIKPGSPDTAHELMLAVQRIWFGNGRTPEDP